MRCKNCGSENEDNLYICQNCGSPLYDEDEPINDSNNDNNNENNNTEDEMGKTRVVPAVSASDINSASQPSSPKPEKPPVDDEEEEKKKKQQTAIIITLAVVLVVIIAVLAAVLVKTSAAKKETTTASTSASESVSQSTAAFTTRQTTERITERETEPSSETTAAPQTYTIEVMSPDGGGSVRGGGEIEVNKEITVMATPDGGFQFDGWYENGKRVSTQQNYTFTVTRDRTLVAKYSEISTEPTEAQ